MRKLLSGLFVLILFIAFVVAPWLIGSLIQYKYNKLLAFYNSPGPVIIQILKYQRGWFSSDVVLAVEINNPEWGKLFNSTKLPKKLFPSVIHFTVQQHIFHGPIIYQLHSNIPSSFGLAAIKSEIILAPDLKKFVALFGIDESVIVSNEDLMSFTGNYFQHLHLQRLQLTYPHNHTQLQLGDLTGNFWIYPNQYRIRGDVKIGDIAFFLDANNVLAMPEINFQFDQARDSHGLWIGSHSTILPSISWRKANMLEISASDFRMYSANKEHHNFISGTKELSIGKLQIEDQEFGPIYFKITVHDLNAIAIADLIKIYKKFNEQGELYQSQLKNNILAKIPELIHGGSAIKLEALNVKTPQGILSAKGEATWVAKNFVKPSNILELIQFAQLHLNLRISKALTQEIIKAASTSAYLIEDLTDEQQEKLADLEDQLDFTIRQNQLLIGELMQSDQMDKDVGLNLIILQRDLTRSDEYLAQIKDLVLTKKISLGVSYILYWQYAQIYQLYDALGELIESYQKSAKDEMTIKLNEFVKQGIIAEDKDDYALSLSLVNGVLSANGHTVQSDLDSSPQ